MEVPQVQYEFTELPDSESNLRVEKDVFPMYLGAPCEKLGKFDKFYNNIIDKWCDFREEIDEEDDDEGILKIDPIELKQKLNTIVNDNVKILYVTIKYPLSTTAITKITLEESITYGMIMYYNAFSYQKIYEIEEQDDCDPGHIGGGLLNRATSHGRFGIWGHAIGDLVYNGISEIKIFDDYIVCYLSVDS